MKTKDKQVGCVCTSCKNLACKKTTKKRRELLNEKISDSEGNSYLKS